MTARRSPRYLLGLMAFIAVGASGCAHSLDMASAYEAKRPAATIPYAGVREETRQYPDYGAIKADILTESAAGAQPSTAKKGRPR